jgi:hypothetical protein
MNADSLVTEPTDALVLKMLADADGAILGWQVPAISDDQSWEPAHAFEDALGRGVIEFDADTDCYVHPDAWATRSGGFTMTVDDSDRSNGPGRSA